jgi:metallo-beta-lactamase class B
MTLLLASLLLTAQGTLPQNDFVPPGSWTEPVEPFRIAGNLYYVGTAELTAFLLVTPDGHILIDAPMEENVSLLLDNITALGFDPQDVEVQLASHAHFDHVGGLAGTLRATGAELVLSERDAALVGRGGKGDFHLGDRAPYPAARADRTIGHLETVTLGDTTLTAHLTPGHTRGCTTWSTTVLEGGEQLEVLSVCSLTVLPGYRLAGDDPSYPGIARDFCRSLEHLRSLEPDLFLASHGSFFVLQMKRERLVEGSSRAFVDPEGYRRWLERADERIEQVLRSQGIEGGCAAVLAAP